MTSYNRDWLTFSAHQKPTVGDSKFSAVQYDHMGWLKCDGRALPVGSWMFLFDVIGYSFGGSGDYFFLPNPQGRVPGVIVGGTQIADTNMSTIAQFAKLGSTLGEYQHKLTIGELASHNHGTDTYADPFQSSFNNSTSMEYTKIVLNDPQHKHTGTTDPAGFATDTATPAISATTMGVADNTGSHTHTFTTNNNSTGMTLIDPGHRHTLNPAGQDKPHNNIQPMLFMGNMYIYSGIVGYGNYPYTTGRTPLANMGGSASPATGVPGNIW